MTSQEALGGSERTRHRRLRAQGRHAYADLDGILRAGFVCHLAFVHAGVPRALPTVYGYDPAARALYVHGSVASHSLVESPQQTVCVTVTHVDGLILARSVFEHGVAYRSAMVYDVPRPVTDTDEKLHGLHVLSEQAAPGQWGYARRPSGKELAATTLLRLGLGETSVKVAEGPPDDGDGPDGALPVWAGELPLHHRWGKPVTDPGLRHDLPAPPHVTERVGRPVSSC